MTINKFELRINEVKFQGNDNDNEKLTVSGYVNKTNQLSQTLGIRKKFVEKILPGAFHRALNNGNEINFLAEHDNAKILSSTRNGSLSLRETEEGLWMEATIAPTSWGRDYHTLIKEGIIQNMSFGMKVVKDSWRKLNDELYERSISDIILAEVSAVRSPAYAQSTIAARSIEVVKDVEIPNGIIQQEEKREMTFEEKLDAKKRELRMNKFMLEDGDTHLEGKVKQLEGEVRNMELKFKNQEVSQHTERAITSTGVTHAGPVTRKIDLVKAKAKKFKGKHSAVARTNIIVRKETEIDVFTQDGEFLKEDMFVEELENLPLKDIGGEKINIKGKRAGYGIEVSEDLMNDEDVELEEKVDNTLISFLEDGLNYSMFNETGSMANLNDDASVSAIIETQEAGNISLIDVLSLTGKLNQEYRDGAAFVMHTDTANQILTNKDFTDYLEFAIDEVTGKKLCHFKGYPIVENDNVSLNRIFFANLKEGFTTLISENSFNKIIVRNDTESAQKKSEKHIMDIYAGGEVTNKDCFVRLDVKAGLESFGIEEPNAVINFEVTDKENESKVKVEQSEVTTFQTQNALTEEKTEKAIKPQKRKTKSK